MRRVVQVPMRACLLWCIILVSSQRSPGMVFSAPWVPAVAVRSWFASRLWALWLEKGFRLALQQ